MHASTVSCDAAMAFAGSQSTDHALKKKRLAVRGQVPVPLPLALAAADAALDNNL